MNLIVPLLVALKATRGLLVPEPSLRMQLRITQSPAPTGAELNDAINYIERHGWAICIRDEISGDLKWKITDAGHAALSERGL